MLNIITENDKLMTIQLTYAPLKVHKFSFQKKALLLGQSLINPSLNSLKYQAVFFTGPFIEIKIEAEFSKLGEKQHYLYNTHQAISFDCTDQGPRTSFSIRES